MSYMHVSFMVFGWLYKVVSEKVYYVLRYLIVVMCKS